jgi:hypothetical protein
MVTWLPASEWPILQSTNLALLGPPEDALAAEPPVFNETGTKLRSLRGPPTGSLVLCACPG